MMIHETILQLIKFRFKTRVIQPLQLPMKQTGSWVRIRATVSRRASVLAALRPTKEVTALTGVATQTDLVIVNREHHIFNFLEHSEAVLEPFSIPKCCHFASSRQYDKSPKTPIIIEGVCVL